MKLFNIFKKKEDPYPNELQDCLDRIDLLKDSLIKMKDCSDADGEAAAQVMMLNKAYYKWLSAADKHVRYHLATRRPRPH